MTIWKLLTPLHVSIHWGFALLMFAAMPAFAQELKTQNVVLITTDGLRWQEVFTGAEKELINKKDGGVANVEELERKYWRETPEERRQALMPFFWGKIAREGQIYGNLNEGSSCHITNTMKFSYPGYNEILTGFADPQIDSNDKKPNENFTVLEWLHRKPAFDGKVAAFSAWDVIPFVINRERCDFPVMGGWEPVPEESPNARQQLLNELIADTTPHNSAEVIDSILYQAAKEHLIRHQPRVFFVGFLETDHWGHAGRYDYLLDSAHTADDYIRRLWELMQSMDQYRGKTTFIITTDHGRGSGLTAWKNHGQKVDGSENMWMAFLGPDTPPLGERKNCDPVTQSQIAATLAAFLGKDYCSEVPRAGLPVRDTLPAAKQ
ncbi:alkaline phosphatase family protein [Planctomicrobium piriforme]|uniref:Type I phosphodiesterase / nucleotide pyrophosphatase n=1 Tax=Planctomicrobium piriforme TaxID=1576369 RepID=A0A1I3T7V3_9PLAN|nr:alkaline phosphatase family protein [Planctomicrobium piriforme]SFJ67144.1 Type I phosphodiesterase / nucleotide pyrophosphatase [Planctomicrobium piriforme]